MHGVLVTAGATEAIAAAMLSLVEPDDEVVALEPYYDSYAATIAMAGGVRVPVTLRPPDFALDLAGAAGGRHETYATVAPELTAQPDRRRVDERGTGRHR